VSTPSSRWLADGSVPRGADYDARWAAMAERGESIHGEADLIHSFSPRSVLDAGCGTGRVAIELAARGVEVVGVDLDPSMLAEARAKATHLVWIEADLAAVDLGRAFDVVAMPGNVMVFVHPGTEAAVVRRLAQHVAAGGVLVAGFQLGQGYTLDRYDADCVAAGMELVARYATWHSDPYEGGDYAVSVHGHTVSNTASVE
jgi:SAM-dependent methyltransferase